MPSHTASERRKRKTKLTPAQEKGRSKIAEKLKGKPGINPFAVATSVVKKKKARRR